MFKFYLTYLITLIILYNYMQWFVYKPKAINTQGKLQNIFMQMKHLGDLGICFHIVTITICSFLTALSILLSWRFGNHYEKFKFPLDTEMYELRKTYFRVNPSRANTAWKSRKKKSWNKSEFLKTSLSVNWQNWMANISNGSIYFTARGIWKVSKINILFFLIVYKM